MNKIDFTKVDWTDINISVDVSTSDEDYGNRIFARCIEVQVDKDGRTVLLCEEESRNF